MDKSEKYDLSPALAGMAESMTELKYTIEKTTIILSYFMKED